MKLTPALVAVAIPLAACTTFDQFTPQPVVGLEPAAFITAGGFHTCAVLENGNRACWGSNSAGQLGVPTPTSSTTPLFVPIGADLSDISAGGRHTCGIVEGDGTPLCWGDNREDQLGFGSGCADGFACTGEPQIVSEVGPVVAIAAGGPRIDDDNLPGPRGFTCAALPDLSVACWGASPSILASRTEAIDSLPKLIFDGDDFPIRGVVSLSAGARHACGVDEGGALFCWGNSSIARRRDDLPPVASVAAGGEHTCVATKAGAVICFGQDLNSQSSGEAGGCLEDCSVGPTEIAGIADAVEVAAGQRHSCALTGDGDVFCWGSNQNGQLGVEIGSLASPPRRVGLGEPAVQIEAGDAHTCALLGDGDIRCWGADSSGQLGIGR